MQLAKIVHAKGAPFNEGRIRKGAGRPARGAQRGQF